MEATPLILMIFASLSVYLCFKRMLTLSSFRNNTTLKMMENTLKI